MTEILASAKIITTDSRHQLLEGVGKGYVYGGEAEKPSNKGFLVHYPNLPIRPIFHSADDQATTLGSLNVNGLPGLVVKQRGGWNSIYSSVGAVPAKLLANMAAFGGGAISTAAKMMLSTQKTHGWRFISATVEKSGCTCHMTYKRRWSFSLTKDMRDRPS